MKKANSYLPVFTGFYNSLFEYNDEERDIEEANERLKRDDITWDDINWDYQEYRQRIAEACTGAIEHELKYLFDIQVNIEKLVSPREYNFANDSIHVEYTFEKHVLKDIREYLIENKQEYQKYLTDRYTSRSGFISSYSNDVDIWIDDNLPQVENNGHYLGSILEFVFKNEGFDQLNLYYAIDSETGYIDYSLKETETA